MKKLFTLILTTCIITTSFAQKEKEESLTPNGYINMEFVKTFNPKKHAAGRLIVYLPNGNKEIEKLKACATNLLGSKYELQNLGNEKTWLLKFEKNNTQQVLTFLKSKNIDVVYDEYLQNNTQGVIYPNDPKTTFFASDQSLALSADLDSLNAYLLPTYRNNTDDINENVKLVMNELADPFYISVELPDIDSINSLNLYSNDGNFSTPRDSHGTQVLGNCFSKQGNSLYSYGVSNVGKYITWNIHDFIGPLSSLFISEIIKATNFVNTNLTKSLILNSSHTTPGFSTAYSDALINANNTQAIIIVHAAGNSTSSIPDWAATQNFDSWLTVGASTPSLTPTIASFSNYGSWVDVYMQGTNMRSLELLGAAMNTWQGTSASSPVVAGMINIFWNVLGGRNSISPLQIKTILKNSTRILIPQPDATLKPWMHLWDIFCNKIWPITQTYQNPINQTTTSSINLNAIVNDLQSSMSNKLFYILNGSTWTLIPSGILNITALPNGVKQIKFHWTNSQTIGTDGTNTFSEITRSITLNNTFVAPVKLTSFTTNLTNCSTTTLHWQTTQEQNNKGFTIEQSTNAIDFYSVGFVPSKGNGSTVQNYNYTTSTLINGKIYFRLKQIDNDGRFEYSPVVSVVVKCAANNLTISPNPANKIITIQGLQNNSKHSYEIYDGKGALIKTIKEVFSNTINIEELAVGIYYLKIDGSISVKFIKE
jgi:hypothetical protein